jgi:hypothetical protein
MVELIATLDISERLRGIRRKNTERHDGLRVGLDKSFGGPDRRMKLFRWSNDMVGRHDHHDGVRIGVRDDSRRKSDAWRRIPFTRLAEN